MKAKSLAHGHAAHREGESLDLNLGGPTPESVLITTYVGSLGFALILFTIFYVVDFFFSLLTILLHISENFKSTGK